ncbi:MAG: MATE family efflux transporter [Lactimicrobium massiliense]
MTEAVKNTKRGRELFTDRDLKRLILPFLGEQLLVSLVGIADAFMVSFAGEEAVSGVTLTNMLVTFFLYVFTALASGGAVVVSQYIGKGNREESNDAASQLLMVSGVISGLCMVLVLLFNRPLLSLLFGRVEPGVMAACVTYQRIVALSFLPLGIYNAGAAVCRSIGRTSITMKISILANIINVVGNSIGIFVLHAGVAGVAWPTFLSRLFSAVAVTMICFHRELPVYYENRHIFAFEGDMVRRILGIAVPNSIENGIFQLVKIVLSTIPTMFGTAQVAANGIAQTIWSLAALMVITMGPVYITVIGRCMGAGDTEAAEYYFRRLNKITVVSAVAWNAVILALTPLFMRVYPVSDEVRHLIVILVLIHNLFNGAVWPFGGALPNGLRAAGDVRFNMIVSIASTVLVRFVFSWVLGVQMKMGVIGVALAMAMDWCVRAVICLWRYKQGKWKTMTVIQ